jgi:hypothetical protein
MQVSSRSYQDPSILSALPFTARWLLTQSPLAALWALTHMHADVHSAGMEMCVRLEGKSQEASCRRTAGDEALVREAAHAELHARAALLRSAAQVQAAGPGAISTSAYFGATGAADGAKRDALWLRVEADAAGLRSIL